MPKKKKNNEMIIPEEYLICPACTQFPECGGCNFQDADYAGELKVKGERVTTLIESAVSEAESPLMYQGIVPAPETAEYRNKMEFSFGDKEKGGALQLGMRKKRSYYEVSDGSECLICDKDFRLIVKIVRDYFAENSTETFYHKSLHTGALRNVVVRKAYFTGEILVNLVTCSTLSTPLYGLVETLKKQCYAGILKGVLHTVNDAVADVVKADKQVVLYGESFIRENILGLTFKISPFSFFQTNSRAAELLYGTVREFAGDIRNKTVFDLYCGTGTITQILAKDAKQCVGIEIVEEAVLSASENAVLNNLDNCRFLTGDVLKTIDRLNGEMPMPDLIVIDPPREGIHGEALKKIVSFSAPEIIYVSCNPKTLARDLPVFETFGYKVGRYKCHDMFPRTKHVETVVLMSRMDG